MAATIQILRKCGAAGATTTDITSINTRANTTDAHSTNDTSYPIKIPSTPGTNYSYWVTTRLNCTVTPAGTINNLRWYTDGSDTFGTGVTAVVAKASTGANAGYRQATGTAGETGIELTQVNHTGLDAAPGDAFGYTSAAPLALVGTITNPTTGEFGDHVVYQVAVDQTAGTGATTAETFTWKYDET